MKSFVLSSLVLALASSASADVVHADIWVTASGGSLVTAGWDHTTDTVLNLSQRVFEGEFGADPDFPFAGDEPGVGSDLAPGTLITMNLLPGLGSWNGAGFDSTSALLGLQYGPQFAESVLGGSVSAMVPVDGSEFHWHPEYFLSGPNGSDPANGIFLAQFTFSTAGLAASQTLWIVFNLGMGEEDHEAAVEWVELNLVPTPGAIALLAVAGLAGRRRR